MTPPPYQRQPRGDEHWPIAFAVVFVLVFVAALVYRDCRVITAPPPTPAPVATIAASVTPTPEPMLGPTVMPTMGTYGSGGLLSH